MSAQVQAYPLAWPTGVKRTDPSFREHAQFGQMKQEPGRSYKTKQDRSIASCVDELVLQVSRLGGDGLVISANLRLRKDGFPISEQKEPTDPGVAIYFTLKKVAYCLPCDKWNGVADNLWAVAKHIDAMRGMARWGVGSVEQNFMGYKALTAEAGKDEDWWTVLGLERTASEEQIRAAHRTAAGAAHPDRGGSSEQMARINTARDRALAEKGGA